MVGIYPSATQENDTPEGTLSRILLRQVVSLKVNKTRNQALDKTLSIIP